MLIGDLLYSHMDHSVFCVCKQQKPTLADLSPKRLFSHSVHNSKKPGMTDASINKRTDESLVGGHGILCDGPTVTVHDPKERGAGCLEENSTFQTS